MLYSKQFRSDDLKINNDFDLKYGIFFNYSTLQIVANILMSYYNFKYFESYSIVANIFVSIFLISFSLLLLFIEKKNHRQPTLLLWSKAWDGKKFNNVLIWLAIFTFLCLQNFVMIRYFSFGVNLYQEFKIDNAFSTGMKLFFLSLFILGCVLIQLKYFHLKLKFDKTSIQQLINEYNLNFNDTYFFIEGNAVLGFQSGSYIFRQNIGLFDGERWYSRSVVLDYLTLSGIGFKDLDEGHVKNIEMYGIGV